MEIAIFAYIAGTIFFEIIIIKKLNTFIIIVFLLGIFQWLFDEEDCIDFLAKEEKE